METLNKLDLSEISTNAKLVISKMIRQLNGRISSLGKANVVAPESLEEISKIISDIEELHKFITPRVKTIGSKKAEIASLITKPLEKVYNLATTIRDTAESGDNVTNMLPRFRKQASVALDSMEENLEELIDRKEHAAPRSIWDRYEDKDYTIDNPAHKHQAVKLSEILKSDTVSLAKYAAYKNKLPKEFQAEKLGYTFCVLPVVSLMNTIISPNTFNKAGFETGSIGGYPVFEDQTIIAISRTYAKSNDTNTKKILALALKTLETKHKKKYTLVHDDPAGSTKTPSMEYYWIMEDRVLHEFQTIENKKLFVKDWNFPF